jgi:mono/diheme cytochrome c family protein
VSRPCDGPGADTDGDGISDAAEIGIGRLIEEVVAVAPEGDPVLVLQRLVFDPDSAYSTGSGGSPIPDFDQISEVSAELDTIVRNLQLAVDNADTLMAGAVNGLAFLEEAADARRWAFDEAALAEAFDGDIEATRRAIGLFNSHCARCHTAGYSAGVAFTQEAGSGGFGPSLRAGRSATQFPDFDDQYDFIVNGSENGEEYGVNGVGRGWMPGFGESLTPEDIRLIVTLERNLP